ncbi:MAG: DNA adenine methylase [Candidatus Aenigmarchaeota archaeon]|jgi:DNA adenine methylase|nr:DNA adenine methylase [Candidatus Aenigmarchaeota archaeon]
MKYMGSKNRIAKYILPIMLAEKLPNQWWVEPFVGGANIIDKVQGKRIGADINPYLIDALIAIRDQINNLPKNNKEFTEADYKQLKVNSNYKYKGYAGFAFSYGGKWLGGWCRDRTGKRDYVQEAYRNALKQSSKLSDIIFTCVSYSDLEVPPNSLIYCDPPYEGTTKYKVNFDHKAFWQWCRDKENEGHTVFVSEYNAPEDFECVWQKEIVSSLTKDTGSKTGIEKLFRLRDRITCVHQIKVFNSVEEMYDQAVRSL